MLRRTKKEKLMCTPETLNHYIGRKGVASIRKRPPYGQRGHVPVA